MSAYSASSRRLSRRKARNQAKNEKTSLEFNFCPTLSTEVLDFAQHDGMEVLLHEKDENPMETNKEKTNYTPYKILSR